MKILKNYKNLVSELFEVDDTKIIKYKDKDGENKEMSAKSAKTMPDEHPAKQAWDKEKEKEDGGEEEKPSGQKLGGSDFDRIQISDPDDEDSEVGKYLKSKGMTGYDDSDDEGDIDRSKSYDGRISGDDGGAKSISDEEFEKLNTFGDYSYKTTDNYQTAEDDNMMGNVRSSIFKDIVKKTGVDEMDFIDIAAYYNEEDYDTLGDYYDDLMKQAKEDKAKETKGESFLKEQLERFGGLK